MEKQEYSQLELFNQGRDSDNPGQRFSGTFLAYIRTYERLVLMLIGFVITGVVCFCVGVEKGKDIALARVNSNMDIALGASRTAAPQAPARSEPKEEKQVPLTVSNPVVVARSALPVAPPVAPTPSATAVQGKGYTIQLATFSGEFNAQKEITALKKQGLLPVLRPSGKYTVLCVGNFPNQETAKSLLTQLKRKYRDCYIRRL